MNGDASGVLAAAVAQKCSIECIPREAGKVAVVMNIVRSMALLVVRGCSMCVCVYSSRGLPIIGRESMAVTPFLRNDDISLVPVVRTSALPLARCAYLIFCVDTSDWQVHRTGVSRGGAPGRVHSALLRPVSTRPLRYFILELIKCHKGSA